MSSQSVPKLAQNGRLLSNSFPSCCSMSCRSPDLYASRSADFSLVLRPELVVSNIDFRDEKSGSSVAPPNACGYWA